MKFFFTCLILVFINVIYLAQNVQVEKPVYSPNYTNLWGNDLVVLNNEPAGVMHGIQQSNGDIFIAINDTLSTTNLGLIIRKSTNAGLSWETIGGITNRGKYENIKLIRSSLDSIYCFFQFGYRIYSWNINTDNVKPFVQNDYRAFDVEISSTNNMYIFVDSLANNSLVRYSSTNFGYNWGKRGSVSSAAAFPKVTKSLSGDTLFLNYYGPILADTTTSIIRVARYRELSAGTLSSDGFQDLATSNLSKNEYKMAVNNGVVWFIYSVDDAKSEIWARQSTNNGTTYGTAFKINPAETVNNFWFDIQSKYPAGSGFDLIYYSDSTQTGVPTILTDKIQFGFSNQNNASFLPFNSINDVPAVLSTNKYKPIIVELGYSNNTGIVWVGETESGKKVYWDSFLAVPVELINFGAELNTDKIILNWSTATETNNLGFEIEKKIYNNWEKIGSVAGMGTSSELNNYSFTDYNTSAHNVFYRLKQIDFDGTIKYSKQIEVNIPEVPLNFSLSQNFPNPFNPSTLIKYSIPNANIVILKIYDVLGSEITTLVNEFKNAGTYEVNFNALNLSSGIYFYKIKSGNFNETKKMLLLK